MNTGTQRKLNRETIWELALIKPQGKMKTQINSHDILWRVDTPAVKELDSSSEEHIEYMIQQGYTCGELHITYGRHNHLTASGWWEIVKWQDIALELYNAINNTMDEVKPAYVKKATERFNQYWN